MVDRRMRRAWGFGVAAVTVCALAACTSPPSDDSITGTIAPLAAGIDTSGWSVTAWSAAEGDADPVATATASDDGTFTLDFDEQDGQGVLFVEAHPVDAEQHGLAVVIGDAAQRAEVTLNERTTVAAGYALAQFFDARVPSGASPGVDNAVAMAANLADPATGGFGEVLTASPNGSETSTLSTFTSLANIMKACLLDDDACDALYAAGEGQSPEPASTAAAFASIARDPSADVDELYELSLQAAADEPGLSDAPAAWTLALRFDGDGEDLAGPGNFAVDPDGHIWINNNYQYNADPETPVCGSDEMFEFSPAGALVGTYSGAGLSGSGYGIEFTPTGELWFSNFGFAAAAPGCPEDEQPPHNSMSLFDADQNAVSPDSGYTQGDLSWPQGIEVTDDGSVWIANCGNDTVALYPQGDPDRAINLGTLGLQAPFDVVDNGSHIFVTGTVNDTVAILDRDGSPISGSPLTGSFAQPMGAATDAAGNVWIANSGGITLPCPARDQQGRGTPSIVMISPDGATVSDIYSGGGLTLPWGIATDGDGNVWAANFEGRRISHFCGAEPATCPRGLQTGEAISPDDSGYSFDGLERSTGIIVDPSGNVWTTNNWREAAVQTNPGGHEIVAFIGLAQPVPVAPFTP